MGDRTVVIARSIQKRRWYYMNKRLLFALILVLALTLPIGFAMASDGSLTPEEQLGKDIFFDTDLSSNGTMSCAACHDPEVGFVGPISDLAVYPGAVHTRFGNRKPPTAAYAGDSPILDQIDGLWIGGMFWDGRATGWTLGDPLAEQAQGPFLNPLEQNMPNARSVCIKVAHSDYADLFKQVWGEGSLDFVKWRKLQRKDVEGTYVDGEYVDGTYDKIARSIAAYERSAEVNPFSSKYDYFLKEKDPTVLTTQEALGLALFEGKAKCSACHISEPGSKGESPLFTEFTYDNLGIPKNPENPFYSMPKKWNPDGYAWVDLGLGGFLQGAGYEASVYKPEKGKHKVPTLRNVDLRPNPDFKKVYGHNGYFTSLEQIVHFYNTRDVENSWPEPEYAATVNTAELGDLHLSADDEAAIVAFLKTLSDGYKP